MGVVEVSHMGTPPGYGLVWFNGEGVYNILSMAKVTKKFPVSYDSADGYQFIHQKADLQLVFKRILYGLYYHDVGDRKILMVSTITGNSKGYTSRESLWRQHNPGRDWT